MLIGFGVGGLSNVQELKCCDIWAFIEGVLGVRFSALGRLNISESLIRIHMLRQFRTRTQASETTLLFTVEGEVSRDGERYLSLSLACGASRHGVCADFVLLAIL